MNLCTWTDYLHNAMALSKPINFTAGDPVALCAICVDLPVVPTDFTTQTPTVGTNSPQGGASIALGFTLPEAALAGSVTLRVDSIGSCDANAPHVLILASAFEHAGAHTAHVSPATLLSADVANVSSLHGVNALVHSCSYRVQARYQDYLVRNASSLLAV